MKLKNELSAIKHENKAVHRLKLGRRSCEGETFGPFSIFARAVVNRHE